MTGDGHVQRHLRRAAPTSRTEAFSDGVMAIAITLLVLELKVPAHDDPAVRRLGLWHELAARWPSYVAYLTAFLTIGIMWLNHHGVFRKVARIDKTLGWWNLGLLLTISVLPWPTALMAEYVARGRHADARVATMMFAVLAVVNGLMWSMMWQHLRRHAELLEPPYDAAYARRECLRCYYGVATYSVTVAVAALVPVAALFLFLAVALFYALTSEGSSLAEGGVEAGGEGDVGDEEPEPVTAR